MAIAQARGLHNFISEIRNCQTKEAEIKRVEKELAHIRQKFTASDKLNSYHRKKYVWKLVYIFVLGYDVDFGHVEAVSLMTSPKYSEKIVGYAAVALMVHSGDELMAPVVNCIKQDLARPDNAAQSLALACIANISSTDLANSVASDVQRLLVTRESHASVRKKAALCLLKLFRSNAEVVVHGEWADRMSLLLEQKHLGVLTSSMSLLLGFASKSPADYEGLVPYVIHNLSQLVINKQNIRSDYLYYSTPSPWLQVKLLKFLQLFPAPSDTTQRQSLFTVLRKIITHTDASESVNKSNADHAVLFESVNLVIHQGMESDEKLRSQALALLGRFISVREPNIRYIGLQTMARMAQIDGNESIKKHEATVLVSLKDADVSVRRRALDLLFVMCDADNSKNIVEELMTHLETADPAIREEMVLKVAIVAEKYATDLTWYVAKILQLIINAGDFVSDDIWHRLIQIVTNNKDVQAFAAEQLFSALQEPHVHETLLRVGAYVLGEFGFLIAEQPGKSGEDQFNLLLHHMPNFGHVTHSQMLSTFVKLANLYEECRPLVAPVFERYKTSGELEVQQRAVEYSVLPKLGDEMMEDVLREMPPFAGDRQSNLEKRLINKDKGQKEGGSTWVMKKGEEAQSSAGEPEYEPPQKDEPPPNLLDLDSTETPPSATPAGSAGIEQGDLAKMKAWFNALVIGPQGLLFENDTIQIALRHAYQAHQARVAVYMHNKSASIMQNINAQLPSERFLNVNVSAKLPQELESNGKTQMQLTGECMLPFDSAPECIISFTVGNVSHKYPLRLPVVTSCFMEPLSLTPTDFQAKWDALAGEEREQQVVFESAKPIDAGLLDFIKTSILNTGLHQGVVSGSEQNVISAASTFRTGTAAPNVSAGASPSRWSVGCLLRLEANPTTNMFRLTVRAVHGTVSVGLKNVVKAQLSK